MTNGHLFAGSCCSKMAVAKADRARENSHGEVRVQRERSAQSGAAAVRATQNSGSHAAQALIELLAFAAPFVVDAGAMQAMVAPPPVSPREDARYSANLPEIPEEDAAQIQEIDGAQASLSPAVPPRVVADGPHERDYLRRKILVQENLGGLWERLGPAEFEKREAEIYRTFKRNPYVRDLIPDAPEACSVGLDVQENPRPTLGAGSSSGQQAGSSSGQEEGIYVACSLDAQGNVVECAPLEDGGTANLVDPAVLATLAQALGSFSLVPKASAQGSVYC